jgi:glycosyltransferase involved in cell wall biosynthesis
MKVLWFSNTPANSDEFLGNELKGTGGWLKSLDSKLQEKVDLHIAFYSAGDKDNYRYLNTSYYPIREEKRKLIKKITDRIYSKIVFREDVYKYLQIISEVKPDIIHIHGTERPFGFIQENVKIPVVISIQGNITVYRHKFFNGVERSYLNWFDNLKNVIVKNTSFEREYKRFVGWSVGEQEILRECKYILGRTDWDRRISRVLAPNSKYYFVSEILRDSFYKPVVRERATNDFVISTTNGNSLYKGFETLCHALSLLNKLNVNKLEWRVAGISENHTIVEIVKKKLGKDYPGKNLVLLGSLNEEQLCKNLIETDLYVMTSHIENSPNNLSEAMLLGLPCIATFAGGTGALIENHEDGILIQDGDPWVMAGAILELLSNDEKMKAMGEKARAKALKRHDPNLIVDDLLSVYKNVVSTHK